MQAIVDYGFTERQARFLVLVMRHAGLCVKRQYAIFAGVANGGEKCNAFFRKLIGRHFAVETACIHNRARLYHVHHKSLYHAIGDPDSRYRRPVSARSAAERLMRLDAALVSANLEWLTTPSEKAAYLRAGTASEANRAAVAGPDTAQQWPDTFPIGIDQSGRVVLLYLATVPWTDDFRRFLAGNLGLLSAMPIWTLRLVFPQQLSRALDEYRAVVHEELEMPLKADTIYDLKRYFFHRRRGTDLNAIPEELRAFLVRAGQVFAAPRFRYTVQAVAHGGRGSLHADFVGNSGGHRSRARPD